MLPTVLLLQAVVLAIGLAVVFRDVRHRVGMRLQDNILEQNVRCAESLARTMNELGFGEAYCGSIGRERAQRLIEELRLPAGGFVCLLDEQDKIICHPGLRQDPTLCGVDLSNWRILSPDDTQTILGDSDRSQVVIGTATWLRSGRHFVAAQYIPSMKARLVVQQPESGLLAFGEAVASGAMLSATFLGAVILMLTGTISFVLIRRHNRVLSEINQGLESEVARRVGENLATRHSLIIGLAKLAESRDSDTGEHLDRICSYAEILARQLSRTRPEITEHWLADLRLAATLHDIGKVGVPDVVLNKPGKFDARERAVMERHPLIGAETLEAVRNRMGSSDLLDLSIDIARHHHERWDGTGYPDGLKGPQIPIAARIIAVADVYDALTSPRVYKPAISHSESVRIISGGRGTHFDPEVVDAFEAVADEFDRVRSTFRFPDAAQNPPVARLAA